MGPSRASIVSTYTLKQHSTRSYQSSECRTPRQSAICLRNIGAGRGGLRAARQKTSCRAALARSRAHVQGWHIIFSHCSCALVWQLRVRRSARLLWIVEGNFAVSQSRHRPSGRSPGSLRLVRCRWSLCWLAGDWPCPYCLCGTVCSIDVVDLESST